jgi:LuxR family maltose regulon positive regulatory protein
MTASSDDLHFKSLSPRQGMVLAMLAAGATGREISTRLDLALSTVRAHIKHVVQRLGATSREHAVMLTREVDVIR